MAVKDAVFQRPARFDRRTVAEKRAWLRWRGSGHHPRVIGARSPACSFRKRRCLMALPGFNPHYAVDHAWTTESTCKTTMATITKISRIIAPPRKFAALLVR